MPWTVDGQGSRSHVELELEHRTRLVMIEAHLVIQLICEFSMPRQITITALFLTTFFAQSTVAGDKHQTQQMKGWTVHVSSQLMQDQPQKTRTAIGLLSRQLQRVVDSVPAEAVQQLRKVPIWLNPQYQGQQPRAEYHPSKGWLENNDRDPQMAKAIEITNVSIFEAENRRMPDLILHELAHAYHDQVLGFDEERIIEAFRLAKKSGTYDSVKRFTGRKTITDKAYAMSNHKEYFAETTEAYFGRNDFYPFDRKELVSHDPQMLTVLKRCWGIKD